MKSENRMDIGSKDLYWIGIAGLPGSGKTTTAKNYVATLLKQGISAVHVPMDGYHYSRAQLDGFENPALAHERRGAPFTFNGQQLLEDIQTCIAKGSFAFPSFDHALKDPVAGDIVVDSKIQKVVVMEGNYLLLANFEPWPKISSFFDETWFIATPIEVACERLARRHQQAWGWPLEECIERVKNSDLLNMHIILENKIQPDKVIHNDDHQSVSGTDC